LAGLLYAATSTTRTRAGLFDRARHLFDRARHHQGTNQNGANLVDPPAPPSLVAPPTRGAISWATRSSTAIRRTRSGCCARAASCHPAAVPPRSVMNSRRLISFFPSRGPRRLCSPIRRLQANVVRRVKMGLSCPSWVLCHEYRRSKRRCATVREMKARSFEVGNQVLISSHRKLLLSKAMVVNVAEKSEQDFDRHD
jgi:hypothetical protein